MQEVTGAGFDFTPVVAAELFVVLLVIASAVALVARRTILPYSVALVLAGLAISATLPRSGTSSTTGVDPDLLLFVLLPGLVFEAALKTRIDDLRGSLRAVIVLAAPGVLISAGIVAVVLHLATGMDLTLAFVVGSAVAATDPAAVITTFKRLGAPRRLGRSSRPKASSTTAPGRGALDRSRRGALRPVTSLTVSRPSS